MLGNLSNRTGVGDFPAGLRAPAARLGTFPHGFHGREFSALGGTGVAEIHADGAKLIFKPRVSRQQSHANTAYRGALVAETDAFRHRGRIVCEALFYAR
jgi:hypothetical protein